MVEKLTKSMRFSFVCADQLMIHSYFGVAIYSQLSLAKKMLDWLFTVNCQ